MPQQLTPETRERYLRALAMRDEGRTFADIAAACGYADPATARYAWIGGLRLAGRTDEIPARRSRSVAVTFTTNSGRVTRTLTVPDSQSWETTSNLTFGIEIECVGLQPRQAAIALRNAGIECRDEGYTHSVMSSWKVVTDASLSGRNGTCEVVSPILRGSDGLAEVRTVMQVLRLAGARTNTSCGMHIHIGVQHLSKTQQALVIRNYAKWQGAINSLLLQRRLNNSYCKMRSVEDAERVAQEWEVGGYQQACRMRSVSDRYYNLNLAAFGRYGTFEFRAHHGSLNGSNAGAWIALHLAFIEECMSDTQHNAHTLYLLAGATVGSDAVGADGSGMHGAITVTPDNVAALRTLLHRLVSEATLHDACGLYLHNRAGNVPNNNRNNHQ